MRAIRWVWHHGLAVIVPVSVGALVFVVVATLSVLGVVKGLQRGANGKITHQDATIASLAQTVHDLTAQIGVLNAQIAALDAAADKRNGQLSDVQAQLAAAQDQRAQLTALASSEYRQLQQLLARPSGQAAGTTTPTTARPGPGPTMPTTTTVPPRPTPSTQPCPPLLHTLGVC